MLDAFDVLLNEINKTPDLVTDWKPAVRGEMGKLNIANAPTLILLPDLGTPQNLDEQDNDSGDNKKLFIEAQCFAISGRFKTQKESEDAVIEIALKVIGRIMGVQLTVTIDSRTEQLSWELTNTEFVERNATGSVIAVTFRMPVYF